MEPLDHSARQLADEVARLKQRPGRDLLVAGSAQLLVQTLARHQLVDEYRLMVFPIVLGSGKRLFGEGWPSTPLKIVESRATGAVLTVRLQPVCSSMRYGLSRSFREPAPSSSAPPA